MARVYRAHRSIDRSIDPLSIVLARPWQKKRDGEQWRTRLERGSWVGGASGFVPDHRQLFDSVRSLQSRFNDRHRSRSFSATSRARNARSNVLPRTTRRSTGHVYTLANTCSSQLQFPPTMYRSFPRRFEPATSFRVNEDRGSGYVEIKFELKIIDEKISCEPTNRNIYRTRDVRFGRIFNARLGKGKREKKKKNRCNYTNA